MQARVVEIVDAHSPGLVVVPGMNHHFQRFADPVQAFREEGGAYAADATIAIVEWLRTALR
jgi:hypothetical protein